MRGAIQLTCKYMFLSRNSHYRSFRDAVASPLYVRSRQHCRIAGQLDVYKTNCEISKISISIFEFSFFFFSFPEHRSNIIMPSPSYLHWALAIVSLLLPHPGSASTCRNLTNSRFGTDTPYGFSNTNIYPLETISCPNEPANRTCALPRGTYNLTIERTLNFTASPEDEDAIFELARVSYWSRTLANNRSLWDEEWNDKPRFLDTRENSPDDFSDFFFETRAGLNYTVYVSLS